MKKKSGDLVRDNWPVLYPEHEFSKIKKAQLAKKLKQEIVNVANTILSTEMIQDDRYVLEESLIELLELIGAFMTIKAFNFERIQNKSQIKLSEEGGYTEGYIIKNDI